MFQREQQRVIQRLMATSHGCFISLDGFIDRGNMEVIATLLDQYGSGLVIAAFLLFNLDKIGAALERIAGKLLPSWAEERRLKLEAQRDAVQHERDARDMERTDTIVALKEMLMAYKESLNEAHIERRRCNAELVQVVARYESTNAAFLEAIKDVSSVLQEQSRVLNRIAVKVGVYNDGKDKRRRVEAAASDRK
jgi:hypothetical protein